jgi:hypothetical protein
LIFGPRYVSEISLAAALKAEAHRWLFPRHIADSGSCDMESSRSPRKDKNGKHGLRHARQDSLRRPLEPSEWIS